MKTKTINMIGYRIKGNVTVNFWGGGSGQLEMNAFDILHPEKTLEEIKVIIPQGVNDAQFGVESILYADVDIYELYQDDVTEYVDSMEYEASKEIPFSCGRFQEGINAVMRRIS